MSAPTPTLPKPEYGSPCNGCGRCCIYEICPLGSYVFGRTRGPCPALEPQGDGRLGCGLVMKPIQHAPGATLRFGHDAMSAAAALLVGANVGCDAPLGEPVHNPAFRKKMIDIAERTRAAAKAAALKWGVRI